MVETSPASAPRTMLDYALWHQSRGETIIPLLPNSKAPAVKWQAWRTRDRKKIAEHWTAHPDHNIAICTDAAAVIDVDRKEGVDGMQTLTSHELAGRELPDTETVETPSGGLHLIFSTSQPIKSASGTLGRGLDTRGVGGYVVAAGSIINGKPYRIIRDLPRAALPQWAVDYLRAQPHKERTSQSAVVPVDAERAERRAADYLKTAAPTEGDPDAYAVACRVRDFGVDEPTAVRLMQEFWDPRCDPPRTDHTLTPVRNPDA